ncbi:MAG: GNAT family N-acetyltransferase [Roseovarius sp.]
MTDIANGLHGSAAQRKLQAATLAAADTLRDTPGAVFAARMAGTDDPDRFGWDRIEQILRDQGAITFRMTPTEDCPEIERRLADIGCAITWWDVFDGPRDRIRAACDDALGQARDDLVPAAPSGPDDLAFFEKVQDFIARCGIAPYPAQVLSGQTGPAALAVLTDPADGAIAATAFAYFPYNAHGPHHATAWAGLVAVHEAQRKRGIGVRVNALALRAAVDDLGAERVQQFARTTNLASCRMIERCGLRLRRDVRSGIAQPAGAQSFTR